MALASLQLITVLGRSLRMDCTGPFYTWQREEALCAMYNVKYKVCACVRGEKSSRVLSPNKLSDLLLV